MEIKRNNKRKGKYGIIWILVGIIVMMTVIKIKYGYRGNDDQVVPTPTIQSYNNLAKPTGINYNDYPLWRLLPYQGVGFIVDRYIAPKTLVVKIKGVDSKIVGKAVLEWLKAQGEAGEGHKLQFE